MREQRLQQQFERPSVTHYTTFYISACLLFTCFVISFVILALIQNTEGIPTDLYLAQHRQLTEDWQVKPFVDIILVNSQEEEVGEDSQLRCPPEYEALVSRVWPGTKEICVGGDDPE